MPEGLASPSTTAWSSRATAAGSGAGAVGAAVAVGAGVALGAGDDVGVGAGEGVEAWRVAVAGGDVSVASALGEGDGLAAAVVVAPGLAVAVVARPGLAVASGSASAPTAAAEVAGSWVPLTSPLHAARTMAIVAIKSKNVKRTMSQTFLGPCTTTARA